MKILPIALTLALSTSCAGFQVKASESLANIQDAAASVRQTLIPVVDSFCTQVAEHCREAQDSQCSPLSTCQEIRRQTINSIIALHYVILDANTAMAIGDEESTWAAIDKALELIRQIRIQIQNLALDI